jgi:hypothetical protein
MKIFAILIATGLGAASPALATVDHAAPDVAKCLQGLPKDASDLPEAARRARDALIHDPGSIGAVIESGVAAGPSKTQVELGILDAINYLRCVDAAGSQAINQYMSTHEKNPIVADLQSALQAQASADGQGGNSQGGNGQGGNGQGGNGQGGNGQGGNGQGGNGGGGGPPSSRH